MTALALSNAREARERAARIRVGMVQYLTTLADIRAAWEARDWLALGYENWDDYLAGEFSEQRLRVPAEHRDKAIAELRMAGMSQRAIATSLMVSQSTVGDVARRLTGSGQIEQPERVVGRDGSDRPAARPQSPAPMPEPEPEGVASVNTPTDNPQSRAGEAHAGPGAQVTDPRPAPEAETEFRGSAEAGDPTGPAVDFPPSPDRSADPLDDPEQVEAAHRQRTSESVAGALVSLFMRLDPDPIRWLEDWQPDAYRNRDLPRVRDVFTTTGLRTIAKHLDTIADHLDRTGGSL